MIASTSDDDADAANEPLPARRVEGAQSIRRAIAVLRLVAAGQERGVRLTDVMNAATLNRGTAHRILQVLVEEGTVEQDPLTRRYLIGREVSLLGLARTGRFPIRALAAPCLQHLSRTLGDTTFLTIRNGDDSICIDREPGSFPVKVLSIEIGARRPLGVGVSGLMLLASLSPQYANGVVNRNAPRLQTMHIDPKALLERVELARAQNFAFADKGVVPGSRAAAVPILDATGRTIAGLAMATITSRLPLSRVAEVVQLLKEQAQQIGGLIEERNTALINKRQRNIPT